MSSYRTFLSPLLIALAAVAAVSCSAQGEVPDLERRAQEINRSVMCPVCPGESIDQSQHPLAVQMRGVVDEKLREGWRDGQVKRFFVERYGPSVLLEPPAQGVHLAVWIIPPVGIALALAALYLVVRLMARPRSGRAESIEVRMSADERGEYAARVEAALLADDRRDAGAGR